MPQNKFQGIVFGLIMSYSMAVGMEIYNVAVKLGVNLTAGGFSNLTGAVFAGALKESAYMGALVFVFSNLWGNRLGAAFAAQSAAIRSWTIRTSAACCARPAPWP
jgi:hypothetical protein